MCGIAGIIELGSHRTPDLLTLRKMAAALIHRGPNEEGFFLDPGVGFAHRRLSIVGLSDGQQPMFNEDGSVVVTFNGELFEYPELREELKSRGHVFRTHADTEILVHLWEEMGERMLERLRGQFAFAIYDRKQRVVFLARDRVGICPLHWARRGDTFYFGSEIKAILGSGKVEPKPDLRGIDHIFTYFAMGTRRTMFEGISSVLPGSFLKIQLRPDGEIAQIKEKIYWDLPFPDHGDEHVPSEPKAVEEFREVFSEAVRIRLRADVPVVSYLSGGVDSTAVASTATRIRGESIPTFTIQIADPRFDETDRALAAAATIGSKPTVVTLHGPDISAAYPELVRASDCAVVDTSCAALLCLAKEVHRQDYRVALTGEGADEGLGGYPWFKGSRLARLLDVGGIPVSAMARRIHLALLSPETPFSRVQKAWEYLGSRHAYNDLYGIMSVSRTLFYRPETWSQLDDHTAYEDFVINRDLVQRIHPMNRALYFGYKSLLAGLLLNHKGDRPAMNSSVETRYPFLDEKVVEYCCRIHPKFKLRGIWRDKHLLRCFASDILPRTIANRPKAIFRAPFGNTFFDEPAEYIDQLLSRESMERTGLFDADKVIEYRKTFRQFGAAFGRRLSIEMGLTAVMATQLWYHSYLGGGLCDLPVWSPPSVDESVPAVIRRPPTQRLTAVAT